MLDFPHLFYRVCSFCEEGRFVSCALVADFICPWIFLFSPSFEYLAIAGALRESEL